MPAPTFSGLVSIDIYFGTLFDAVNIPFDTGLISQTATKKLTVTGSCVRQTTWLGVWQVNVPDYQAIVGAQFAAIQDLGTEDHGIHWYYIQSYSMENNMCCQLLLEYDPLLSIGVNRIYGISGTLRRWTVGNDAEWAWTRTTEPLSPAMNNIFTYNKIKPVTSLQNQTQLVGFPYDMTQKPQVILYASYDGSDPEDLPGGSRFYVPTFYPANPSRFSMEFPGQTTDIGDGLVYYTWNNILGTQIWENYNAAIGLGYNIVTNAWMLPNSGLIDYLIGTSGRIEKVIGMSESVETGFSLLASGNYLNRKTAEVGVLFTLSNQWTGDSVTIANYDLDDTSIWISCNPYSNGCFMARFKSYLFDLDGFSGLVSSVGWQPLTLTAAKGLGQDLANFNTRFAQDINTIQNDYTNWLRKYNMNLNTANYATRLLQSALGGVSNAASTDRAQNALNQYQTNRMLAKEARGTSIGTFDATMVQMGVQAAADFGQAALGIISDYYNTTAENLKYNKDWETAARQQLRTNSFLLDQGTIQEAAPPVTKFASTNFFSPASYEFVVRKQELNPSDRERLDIFLTQYGYNVDGLLLADATYLNCRKRFTFIQADDVRIVSVNVAAPMTRLADMQTISYIQERFSGGLRIWNTPPNFNFTEANEPLENPFTGNTAPEAPGDVVIPDNPPPIPPAPDPANPTVSDLRNSVLRTALSQEGVKEMPLGSNTVKYNTEYYGRVVAGSKYAWCVVFEWWCFKQNQALKYFNGGSKTASCTTLWNYAVAHGQTVPYSKAKAGDIFILSWYNEEGELQRHTGFIAEKNGTSFTSIEGNSSNQVQTRTRSSTYRMLGFINPYGD